MSRFECWIIRRADGQYLTDWDPLVFGAGNARWMEGQGWAWRFPAREAAANVAAARGGRVVRLVPRRPR